MCCCCCPESLVFYLFCQTSPGSKCAVLRRLGGSFELGVITRALPALTSTKTPAAGRTPVWSYSLCDSVSLEFGLSLSAPLHAYSPLKQSQYLLHPCPAHPPRDAVSSSRTYQRVGELLLLLNLLSWNQLFPQAVTWKCVLPPLDWPCVTWLGQSAAKSSAMARGWRRPPTSTPLF